MFFSGKLYFYTVSFSRPTICERKILTKHPQILRQKNLWIEGFELNKMQESAYCEALRNGKCSVGRETIAAAVVEEAMDSAGDDTYRRHS